MKPKILYWLPNKGCERIFSSITEDSRVDQLIAQSHLTESNELKLKTVKYTHTNEAANREHLTKIINNYRPDIFVQCDDIETMTGVIKSKNIKYVFLNHGIWPHSPNNRSRVGNERWARFDLVCGASKLFRELHQKYAHPNFKAPVAINTLTQFDVLFERLKSQQQLKDHIIKHSKNPQATKLITLFGHHCDDRKSLWAQNAGYYKAVIELAALAEKHNWLFVVKSKTPKVDDFIRKVKNDWAIELRDKYFKALNSKYVYVATPHTDPYRYFCSDLIVCSARSTTEAETALANKPLIRVLVPTQAPNETEHMYEIGTLDFDAAYILRDWNNLEDMVIKALTGDNTDLHKRQEAFIKHLEIIFDGNAHTRLIDAILGIMR